MKAHTQNIKNKIQTLAGHTNNFERLPRIICKNKKDTIIKKKKSTTSN